MEVGLKGAYSSGAGSCWEEWCLLLLLGSSVLAGDGGIWGEGERKSNAHPYIST